MSLQLIFVIAVLVLQFMALAYFFQYYNNKINGLKEDLQLLSKSIDIISEVSKGLGSKLIEQNKQLEQLTHSQAWLKSTKTDISEVAKRFQSGESIDKMASELGLDAAEVQVMKMIREKAEASSD